jgi:hypothetical protein
MTKVYGYNTYKQQMVSVEENSVNKKNNRMKKYFLHNGKDQEGPFNIEELKTKNISRETPIWSEGHEEWTIAEKIEDLKSIFSPTPPPFRATASEPPQNPKIESIRSETEYQPQKRKSKIGKYLLILAIIVIVAIFITYQYSNTGSSYSGETYEEKVMTVEETERSQPTAFLSADGNYNESFWGTKLKVHGTIKNNATVATYKDAVVRVTYYSKTKTELGNKEYTIYETFPPHSTKNFELKIENYKDVNSIGWEVINAVTQ